MRHTTSPETSGLEVFFSVAELLESIRDIDEVLGKIIKTATLTLDVKAGSLMMIKDRKLKFFMATGDQSKKLQNLDIGMGEGIAGWTASNNQPLLIQDVEKDYRWSSKVSEITGFKVRSIACCPLRVRSEVVGVLEVLDRRDGAPLREEDLEKLITFGRLAETLIEDSTQLRAVAAQNKFLNREMDARHRLIGESPNFRKALSEADKIARSNATCIIFGESGTGKELMARYIYQRSARAGKPFIAANCGALPETILERELFGHEKGAFTGAERRQIGLFEAADGGTIFLDEVSEMSPAMQVRFLRVLEERNFYRLGGTTPVSVDVRIIAATNRNLSQLVRDGKFREDLYYRLDVVRLSLPALRERKGDIPLLVEHYLKNQDIIPLSKNMRVSEEAMEYLKNYSWPGNIRELVNAVERALVLSEGGDLGIRDFPLRSPAGKAEEFPVGVSLKAAMEGFKRKFIQKTLESAGGKRIEAAKILEIERTYLSKLIKELGLT